MAVAAAVAVADLIAANQLYAQVFTIVAQGIVITVFVTVVGFALASAIGLGLALMALSRFGVPAPDRAALCRDHPRRADPGAAVLDRLCRRAGVRRRLELADRAAAGGRLSRRAAGARRVAAVARDHGADHRLLRLHRRDFPRRHPVGRHRARSRRPSRSACRAASASASSSSRRRSAPSCRRSATTSSRWSRTPRWSRCSASPTSPRWARSMRRARSASSRPTRSSPIST